VTVSRVRPWFLPTSLAAFLTEVWPDETADAPSEAGPDAPSGTPPDTRSGDTPPGARRPCTEAPRATGEDPADRP